MQWLQPRGGGEAAFWPDAGADNGLTVLSNLPLGVIQMKETASFSFTSIKSSQAYDTRRRQMTPSLKPLNGIALQAVFFVPSLLNGGQLSVQHKHQISNGLHNLLLPVSLHAWATLPSPHFFVSLHPATFSTCAGCTPGPQTRLCVFPALAACHASLPVFLPRHPGNLTTVCPYPLQSLSNLTGQQTQPAPDRHTSKLLKPHLSNV